MKHGKKYNGVAEKIDREKLFDVMEAVGLVKQSSPAFF